MTNEQFARFDPRHDSRVESKNAYQFGVHGYPMNRPEQPVVRVSWNEAMAFCRWLSEKTGERFTLPTEAQWEYACRAGTATPMFYGDLDTDFSPFANLADAKLSRVRQRPVHGRQAAREPAPSTTTGSPRTPASTTARCSRSRRARYQPNAWGLYDMHGNVAEWTRSAYRPYPYDADDGRDEAAADGRKVVRGGSWRDRPRALRRASAWAIRRTSGSTTSGSGWPPRQLPRELGNQEERSADNPAAWRRRRVQQQES